MENNFYAGQPLALHTDQGLEALLNGLSAMPEVLMEIYWEVAQRRRPGWLAKLDEIEAKYVHARNSEVSREVSRLRARKTEALAFEKHQNPVLANLAQRDQATVFNKIAPNGIHAEMTNALIEQIKKIEADRTVAPPPARPSPAPTSKDVNPSVPASPSSSWADTAAQVRHAELSPALKKLSASSLSAKEWAEHSPMALLGYKVGESGMTGMRRQAFLSDFIEKAALPTILPKPYLAEWGDPGTKTRLQRTVTHIAFQKLLREKSNPQKYVSAIGDWEADLDHLQSAFSPTFTPAEWDRLRREN